MKESVRSVLLAGCLIAGSAVAITSVEAVTVGHVWDRSADWTVRPVGDAGTTNGNPDDDSLGNPVWHYEHSVLESIGGDLDDSDPWYTFPGTAQVWDPSWFGGSPHWARGDDAGPQISQTSMTHGVWQFVSYDRQPIVRWESPSTDILDLKIQGNLTAAWSGVGGIGSPVDVDVVIVQQQGSSFIPLLATTVSKPTNADTAAESLMIPVDLNALVAPGDNLLFTHRARNAVLDNRWVTLTDDVTLTVQRVVPEPGTLALMALGLAFAIVPRKHNGNFGSINTRKYCLRRISFSLLSCSIFCCSASLALATNNLLHTFEDPTVTGRDNFGDSIALDGNRALIGAIGDDTNGNGVGQAYLFNTGTGNLLQTFNDPTPTIFSNFGSSVALDGNHTLVGARGDSTNGSVVGQAHLFDTTTGNLLHTFDDPTPTNGDVFGEFVALDGNHVLIGAPGHSTTDDDFVGEAHLFDATSGNLLYSFNSLNPNHAENFGSSVALDGNHVLIGSSGNDSNGNGVGQAYLFDTSGNLLQTFNDPTPTNFDSFGSSVALDGNHVLIGAIFDDTNGFDAGQAHLFDATSGNLMHTFNDPTVIANNGEFGSSVALDGNHVLIGARRELIQFGDFSPGEAHLFDATTGDLLQTFNDPTPTNRDMFGISVALEGGHVLIGARGDDTNGTEVGQAHLFRIVPEPNTCMLLASVLLILIGGRKRNPA